MNYIEVKGGTKKEREIVEATIALCIRQLMPRARSLDIEAKLVKNCSAYGYCCQTDNNRTFELELRKGLGLYDLIATVCHEMVHVKQYYRKELTEDRIWKKRKIGSDIKYLDQPWEKEAFKLEEKLAVECFKKLTVTM